MRSGITPRRLLGTRRRSVVARSSYPDGRVGSLAGALLQQPQQSTCDAVGEFGRERRDETRAPCSSVDAADLVGQHHSLNAECVEEFDLEWVALGTAGDRACQHASGTAVVGARAEDVCRAAPGLLKAGLAALSWPDVEFVVAVRVSDAGE